MTQREDEPILDADAKAALATLVAHLVLHELDEATLEVLRQPEILEVLDKLEPGCRGYLTGRPWVPSELDEAAADYCELFVLPGGVPLFAAAWMAEDAIMSGPRLAARIEQILLELELETRPMDRWGVPQLDHLGVLLAALAAAWRRREAGEHASRVLSRELLLPWIPAFSTTLRQRSKNVLYRAVGALSGELVRWS